METKKIEFLDGTLRYVETDTIAICADDFFGQVMPSQKNHQVKALLAIHEADFEIEGELYFSISKVNDRIHQYTPQKASYDKNPVNFKNYVAFIQGGGCGALMLWIAGEDGNFENKDISYLIHSVETEKVNEDALLQIEILEQENEGFLDSIKHLNLQVDSLQSEKEKLQAQLKEKIDNIEKVIPELETTKKQLQSLQLEKSNTNSDWLRSNLTNSKTMLWATILVIGVFLTFTVLSLKQYIAIESTNTITTCLIYILCCFIAAVWDFSILLFAVNGKRNLAITGSAFQFVFISAKFNFTKDWVDLFGYNGDLFQAMLVKSAICIYSPLLVFQFAELAMKQIKAKNELK